MLSESNGEMSVGLARVRARFVDEMTSRLDHLIKLRSQMDDALSFDEASVEIGQIGHKIAGTAATLGFPELGAEAAKADDIVMSYSKSGEPSQNDVRESVDRLVEIVKEVVHSG